MNIQFDETNLLAEMVGKAHGVTRAEVERAQSKAQKALASFRKQSEAGLFGFPHLPFQSKVIRAIGRYAAEVRGSYDTVCVVGIGGSALGAWALDCGIRGPHPIQGAFTTEHPRLVILDNVDPDFTAAALRSMDFKQWLCPTTARPDPPEPFPRQPGNAGSPPIQVPARCACAIRESFPSCE